MFTKVPPLQKTKPRLLTADGQLVRDAEMPPFQTLPDILIWGQRFFRRDGVTSEGVPTYREGFTYALIDDLHSQMENPQSDKAVK